MKELRLFLDLLETESFPENLWLFELWEDLHYEREIKEDNYTARRQHYFFGTENYEQRSNLELFFSEDKDEAWKEQDLQ